MNFFMVIFTIFFFYILYKFIKKVKLNRNTLYFFVPFILSGTIMIIAPGNFIRTDGVLDGQSVLINVFQNIFSITISFFSKLEVSLPFIVSLITVWLLEKKYNN